MGLSGLKSAKMRHRSTLQALLLCFRKRTSSGLLGMSVEIQWLTLNSAPSFEPALAQPKASNQADACVIRIASIRLHSGTA